MIDLRTQGLLLNPRSPSEVSSALVEAWNKFENEQPALFAGAIGISTSGSTSGGIGSIIVLSRTALELSARAVNRRLNALPRDVWGLVLPMFHVGGYSIPLRARLSGSNVAEFQEPWNAVSFHAWLSVEKVSLLSLVPTQLFDLVGLGLQAPSGLRAVIVGGGRLDEAVHSKARALGWPVLQSYGLTECCSQVATAMIDGDGRTLELLDHVETRIGENEKLWIRSKSLLSARIVFDRELKAKLEHPVDREGWFETADRAEVNRIGFSDGGRDVLKILGREGETVKVMGELVDLVRVRSSIETLALEKPEFARFAQRTWVVAVPEARRENELVLIFEVGASSEADHRESLKSLLMELRSVLAPFEIPSRWVAIEKLPRSSLGKVMSSLLTDEARKRVTE
ncbi:hypothetical protein BH10BDE1_BH10BDE1_17450 [soil metagenome]